MPGCRSIKRLAHAAATRKCLDKTFRHRFSFVFVWAPSLDRQLRPLFWFCIRIPSLLRLFAVRVVRTLRSSKKDHSHLDLSLLGRNRFRCSSCTVLHRSRIRMPDLQLLQLHSTDERFLCGTEY